MKLLGRAANVNNRLTGLCWVKQPQARRYNIRWRQNVSVEGAGIIHLLIFFKQLIQKTPRSTNASFSSIYLTPPLLFFYRRLN